jgi:hypothetical protein
MMRRNDGEVRIYQSLILQACSDLDALPLVPSLSNANDQLCFVQIRLLPTTCPHVARSTPCNNKVLASGNKGRVKNFKVVSYLMWTVSIAFVCLAACSHYM